MTRGDVDDLLGMAWITDAHIDAYAVFLGSKQSRSSVGMKSFLYVSPKHYYKSNKVANSKIMLSHITLASVTASDVVLMPCHVSSHWTLLVCRQKEQCWDFYDSFKSDRHRSNLPDLALSAETISWQEKKDWCKEMPQFRAEIAADILRAFSNIINTNISA
ncbi:hypothetical protein KSP40_PGU004859 [Platanthera guangdongensis]|uniref:Ubiquitin-like protease family profile domain-containing protein n=1 Tax=Platanthera guangdongensis TaxID=2320717 RepID=A0ABR2MHJ5_9ASPA